MRFCARNTTSDKHRLPACGFWRGGAAGFAARGLIRKDEHRGYTTTRRKMPRPPPSASFKQLCTKLEAMAIWCMVCADRCIKFAEPFFVLFAVTMVCLDAATFFSLALKEVGLAGGAAVKGEPGHAASALQAHT